jgi:hypothetical protein
MSLPGFFAVKRDLTDEVTTIVANFHGVIFKILRIMRKIEPNMLELEDLQKKLGIARDLDPLLIINRCKDKIWMFRESIINEDSDFFMKNKFSEFVKNDENKPFMYTMINLIKTKWKELSAPEQKEIWRMIKELLRHIIEYKQATSDHL